MYALIYLLAAGTTAIIALVATWSARSRRHWFWRAAALLTCFVLLVPIGAAELTLLYAPVSAILFLAACGKQWWERRNDRPSFSAGDVGRSRESIRAKYSSISNASGPNRLPTLDAAARPARFSLQELFLVVLLAAVAAWVIARIVQEGVAMDLRKLPIVVALVSPVAWIAFCWADKRRPWPATRATPAAYLLGAVAALATLYATIYWLAWESPIDITIAAACLGCLAMIGARAWLRYFGGLLPATVLIGAIYFASYVHADFVGDWLSADYLLSEQKVTFWLAQRLMYGTLYTLLAIFILTGMALWHGLALPSSDRRNRILSRLSLAALAIAILPLVGLYWRLLEKPQFAAATASPGMSVLANANRLVEQIQEIRKATVPPASSAVVAPLPDTPEMRRLTSELFATLEAASRETEPNSRRRFPTSYADSYERQRVMWVAAQVFGVGYTGVSDRPSADESREFALALLRYAVLAQQEGLAIDAKTAYQLEQDAHLLLAVQHPELSPIQRRELLRVLSEIDARREPLESVLSRDSAWSERFERWRSRLRRVVLGQENTADSGQTHGSLTEAYKACVATARMDVANLAIREFENEHGRLPSALDELVPQFLRSVPIDPYSGQPLVYRPSIGDFELYTVWSDGRDDGGVNVLDGNFNDGVRARRADMIKWKALAKGTTATPVTVKGAASPRTNPK